jgi:hypothetical protein
MYMNHKEFAARLPSAPSPTKVTDKYMFLDSRKVIDDMADLGYQLADARFPKARTKDGHYGIHELDFRRPQDIAKNTHEAPRVLFFNSYDGSKKAQFLAGIIRFACSNGLVIGDSIEQRKFVHLGDYADEILAQIKNMAAVHDEVFTRIDRFREIELDPGVYLQMAEEAAALRFPDAELAPIINPNDLLQVRRVEDRSPDLFTRFNVIQENILKGGVPTINQKGQSRLSSPVGNIEKSTSLNRQLWDLMERYAEAA